MKFNGLGDKLSKTWQRVADKTADISDSVKHMDTWAGDLQVKALKDKIAIAATGWDAIYADEMLVGKAAEDGLVSSGAVLLKQMKSVLSSALVKLRVEADKQLILDTTAAIETALYADKKADDYLVNVYTGLSTAMKGLDEINDSPKILEALDKIDNKANYEALIGAYDYNARCENILVRANYKGLLEVAASDEAADVLSLKAEQQDMLKSMAEISGAEAVDVGNHILDEILVKRAQNVYAHLEDEATLSALNDKIGDYNLSVSVPKNTASYTKHYGGQLLGATTEYTGKALSATGKGYSWLKAKLNKK
ncbi:MAG: hypothetical protein ACTHPO_03350 [Alphaproteobacteria bacterium]